MVLVESQIQLFFKDQTIFLTGGSGFVGKVLIEKLLRACDDLKKIYVMMRPKKGKTPKERFQEIFDYPCFDVLKTQNANFLEKVCSVIGDCKNPDLGLSQEDRNVLISETTCVIHAAANVKFDQTLKEAVHNVRTTKYVLELAKHMTKLRVFVFVSTAFSHSIDTYAEEKFYEPPMKPESFFTLVDAFDDDTLQAITPHLLGNWPNTYVYTKCITEDLIKTAGDFLPITVVRPSIIFSAAIEPVPGWIDNFYGPAGIVVGAALGVIRSMYAAPNAIAPLVPVDYVSNCILAAAYKREKFGTTTIYNLVGDETNQITWSEFRKLFFRHYWRCASENALWYKSFTLNEKKIWHKVSIFLSLTIPAHIADLVLFCLRKPTIAVKNCQRLDKMFDLISDFSSKNWFWDHTNTTGLWNEMSDVDKKLFHFDTKDINWDTYCWNSTDGGRLYLLKQKPDSVPRAQRRLKFLCVAHYTMMAFLYYLLYKVIMFVLGLFF